MSTLYFLLPVFSDSGLGWGAILGIVLGCLAFIIIVLVVIVIVCYVCQRDRNGDRYSRYGGRGGGYYSSGYRVRTSVLLLGVPTSETSGSQHTVLKI